MALIGRWFAKYVVLATMASRFAEILVDQKGIINLMFSNENENTRKNTKYWINMFQKWSAAKKFEQRLDWFRRKRAKNFALDVINM